MISLSARRHGERLPAHEYHSPAVTLMDCSHLRRYSSSQALKRHLHGTQAGFSEVEVGAAAHNTDRCAENDLGSRKEFLLVLSTNTHKYTHTFTLYTLVVVCVCVFLSRYLPFFCDLEPSVCYLTPSAALL